MRLAVRISRQRFSSRPTPTIVKLKEVDAGQGRIWPKPRSWLMDPTGAQVQLPGMHTTEPTFGLPATWDRYVAQGRGRDQGLHTVSSMPQTVLATHLTELLKLNMSELLS